MLAWARQPVSDCTKFSLGWTQPPQTFRQALMISELVSLCIIQYSAITEQVDGCLRYFGRSSIFLVG
jgi:hypothetical protein